MSASRSEGGVALAVDGHGGVPVLAVLLYKWGLIRCLLEAGVALIHHFLAEREEPVVVLQRRDLLVETLVLRRFLLLSLAGPPASVRLRTHLLVLVLELGLLLHLETRLLLLDAPLFNFRGPVSQEICSQGFFLVRFDLYRHLEGHSLCLLKS